MPNVEEGATYPREVTPPCGLPSGWKAIERAYTQNSQSFGQTYIRFNSPCGKHKTVGSVKSAIIADAKDRNVNPDEAVQEWQLKVEEEKNEKKKEREANGYAESPKLEEYVALFREQHGALDGATVNNLPGWRGESKILENCGQICAKYYAPSGWTYPLVKNIEALFGYRIQNGLDVPDFEEARNTLKRDEFGKVINVARRENVLEEFTKQPKVKKRRQLVKVHLEESRVTDENYQKSESLHVIELRSDATADALGRHGVADTTEVVSSAEKIHDILSKRGFGDDTQLLYVTVGSANAEGPSSFLHALSGVYYQRSDDCNGRPCYQQICLSEESVLGVACCGSHVFWSAERSCWKLGVPDEQLASFARCFEDTPRPVNMSAAWLVFKGLLAEA